MSTGYFIVSNNNNDAVFPRENTKYIKKKVTMMMVLNRSRIFLSNTVTLHSLYKISQSFVMTVAAKDA